MALMVSISGIRGIVGQDLTPHLILRTVCAFFHALETSVGGASRRRVVVGRDTRRSGEFIESLIAGSAMALGYETVSLGVATTPTVLLLAKKLACDGGIAVTASHNPPEWNAMKFCDSRGLFLTDPQIRVIEAAAGLATGGTRTCAAEDSGWKGFESVGSAIARDDAAYLHCEEVLRAIDRESIKRRRFKVAIDPGGGAGAVVGRLFLEKLGCVVVGVNEVPASQLPGGAFPRGTEPVPGNLGSLSDLVAREGADIGFAQDPDGDRLAVVSESARAIGEEYTLVLAGEAFLRKNRTDVACNLSTSMMVDDLAERHGVAAERTRIGEINVTSKLLEKKLLFGGEGNGGVIVPGINPCRDSVVGMGLILELLAESGKTVSGLVESFPSYSMVKEKCRVPDMDRGVLHEKMLEWVPTRFPRWKVNDIDGVKATGNREWVHLRLSNTEPVMRIIAEADTESRARELADIGRSFVEAVKP